MTLACSLNNEFESSSLRLCDQIPNPAAVVRQSSNIGVTRVNPSSNFILIRTVVGHPSALPQPTLLESPRHCAWTWRVVHRPRRSTRGRLRRLSSASTLAPRRPLLQIQNRWAVLRRLPRAVLRRLPRPTLRHRGRTRSRRGGRSPSRRRHRRDGRTLPAWPGSPRRHTAAIFGRPG